MNFNCSKCKKIVANGKGVEVLLLANIFVHESLVGLCNNFSNSSEPFWGWIRHPNAQTPQIWKKCEYFKYFVSWWSSMYSHLPALQSVSIMCSHHSLSPHRDQDIVCERMGAILVMSLTDVEYQVTIHEKKPAIIFKMKGHSGWMCLGKSRELRHSTTKSNSPKYTLRMGFNATDIKGLVWTAKDWAQHIGCICAFENSGINSNRLPTTCEVTAHFNRCH